MKALQKGSNKTGNGRKAGVTRDSPPTISSEINALKLGQDIQGHRFREAGKMYSLISLI